MSVVHEFQSLLDDFEPLRLARQRRDEAERNALREALPDLRALLREFEDHLRRVGRFDPLASSGITLMEREHCKILRELFDPRGTHCLGHRVLMAMLTEVRQGADEEALERISSIQRSIRGGDGVVRVSEERAGAESRIDLEVVGRSWLIHIEVKTASGETSHSSGVSQTIREWVDLTERGRRLGSQTTLAIFLTPFGQRAQDPHFLNLGFRQLARSLRVIAEEPWPRRTSSGLKAYADYLDRMV